MFNSQMLKAELVVRGKTLDFLADLLSISRSTVSKKVNGKNEWTLSELQKLGCFLGQEKMSEIFFAQKVS